MPDSDQSTATATSLAVAPPSPRSSILLEISRSKPSRRVFFSDLPPKYRPKRRGGGDGGDGDKNCRPICLAFCAWSCLAVFALVLVVLLVEVLFAVFLHASLPAIALRGVRFAKLEIQNASSSSSIVSAGAEILVEFANENERIELSFGPLTVKASAESVSLGKSRIGAFSQPPRNTTELTVSTAVRRVGADRDDANELAAGLSGDGGGSEAVEIEVVSRGTLGFHVGKIDIHGVPVLISCSAVKAELDHGNKSRCNVRIFPI